MPQLKYKYKRTSNDVAFCFGRLSGCAITLNTEMSETKDSLLGRETRASGAVARPPQKVIYLQPLCQHRSLANSESFKSRKRLKLKKNNTMSRATSEATKKDINKIKEQDEHSYPVN